MRGLKGIEFLLDGYFKELLQFRDVREYEIPAGEHTAKMILNGVVKRSSKELRFSLREGQIVCIEGVYDPIMSGMIIGFARDQSPIGKLFELQKKTDVSNCNLCGNKSLNGEMTIVITGKLGKQEKVGNSIISSYYDLHRIRVFICSDCKKYKESFAKAVEKKDREFGRIGEVSYWRDKDFPYFKLDSGGTAYLFIKDKMKDELDDCAQNKSVTLTFHSPRQTILSSFEFQGGIWIDNILIALLSYKKGFDFSISVAEGKHTISLEAPILNNNKSRMTVFTEKNKTYEFDCKIDRIMGGLKLISRFPSGQGI